MVVQEDERCSIDEERIPNDCPAIDGRLSERAFGEHLLVDDRCPPVKEDCPYLFVVERLHHVVKDGFCGLGIGDVVRCLHDVNYGIVEAGLEYACGQ